MFPNKVNHKLHKLLVIQHTQVNLQQEGQTDNLFHHQQISSTPRVSMPTDKCSSKGSDGADYTAAQPQQATPLRRGVLFVRATLDRN